MTGAGTYNCRFCRLSYPLGGAAGALVSCPGCGAPVDVRAVTSRSGWEEQPAIPDMARLQFGRSHVQISGRTVPSAHLTLAPEDSVFFPHHALLYLEPGARIGNHDSGGTWNRMLSGMPSYLLDGAGPGRFAVSHNTAGEVIALPLTPGRPVWVREGHFLAASAAVGFTWQRSGLWYSTGTGDDRETHYPVGAYDDVFSAGDRPGLLLLHSPGNAFFHDLAPGESRLVAPSALLHRDLTVGMGLHVEHPAAAGGGWRGWRQAYSHRTVWVVLTGPGRVAVRSVNERPEHAGTITGGTYSEYRW